jgi:large subunit ribosomal protein L31
MRTAIHPMYKPVTITCVGCGTKVETRSTKGRDFSVDVCSHCHPFYTGRQKFVDSAGRVERFQKKWAAVDKKPAKAAEAKPDVTATETKVESKPKAEKKEAAASENK